MGYGDVDVSGAADAGLFALPAMFITLRETTEGAIIVSVLLGMLDKCQQQHLKRYVWFAVALATLICICLAAIAVVVIMVLQEQVLEGDSGHIVQGIISVLAAILIGMVASMLNNILAVTSKYEGKMSSELSTGYVNSKRIFWVAFITIFREGLETIIFFIGIGAAFPAESLPIPAIVGAIIGVLAGVALYRCGGKMAIAVFFKVMMVLLVFIGAGIFTYGIRELQEAGVFGVWDPESERPPLNRYLFDISDCCGLDNQFWVLMRVMFGYQPQPTGLEFLAYFSYQIIVWTALFCKFRNKQRKAQGRPTLCEEALIRGGCKANRESSKEDTPPSEGSVDQSEEKENASTASVAVEAQPELLKSVSVVVT